MKIVLIMGGLLLAGLLAAWSSVPPGQILAGVPFGAVLTSSDGRILRLGLAKDDKYRLPVKLDEISPVAAQAVLDYEDRHFFRHPGVNPVSLARGAMSLFGGRRMGGSTITMQVARLRYGLATSSIAGKCLQILMAIGLEMRHSKEDILEAYFNLAPYGGNVEGLEAASRIYFHKPARMLTESEARALAVVPQNPHARHPARGRDFDKARLRACQYAESDGVLAGKEKLQVYSLAQLPFAAPHLSSEILAKGRTGAIAANLQSDLQKMLERGVTGYAERGRAYGLSNAAAMLVRLDDMRVCALAGSSDFFNAAIQGQIDGTRIRRSPGSTLKPFIYALAIEQGLIHPQTILADAPRSFGGYDPENFDHGFKGPIAAGEALRASRNLPAIILAEKLAGGGLYDFLDAADIHFDKGPEYYGLALALGGAELAMRDLAGLYALLANAGLWRPLRYLEDDPPGESRRLLSPEAAWLALQMLRRPEAEVASFGRRIPVYYKTGTSNGLRDAWTAGIVGQYVLIVWAGNFDNSSNPALVGAETALPLFEEMAVNLASMRQLEEYVAPSPGQLNVEETSFCKATGDIFQGQCDEIVQNWFIPGVSPTFDTGVIRKVWIDRQTGLRQCQADPEIAEPVWLEFWPTDLAAVFAAAGIYKSQPPPWAPGCEGRIAVESRGPKIMLPRKNVIYHRSLAEEEFRLPLQAVSDVDAGKIHWFSSGAYLGSALPGETIYWNAPAGKRVILAVDDNGRETRQTCVIENDVGNSLN